MKRALARLSGSLTSGLITGAIITLAALLPAVTAAADTIKLAGSMGIANVADGGNYSGSISAGTNQVVKLQVYYTNQEDPASNKVASNVRVKITMPSQGGKTQNITSGVKGDNTADVGGQAVVNLDRDDATLQYIPGSAVWKHNTGSSQSPKIEETKLSDDVVLNGQGTSLGNVQPGDPFAGTVSVQARVLPTSTKVTMESEKKADADKWSANNSANPGDAVRYIISYQNTGNSDQNNLIVRSQLPDKVQLVAGSATLYNVSNKDGAKIADDLAKGGVNIGNYGPGANAYVTFEANLPGADALACGGNTLRAIGSYKPQDVGEYFNTAVTTVRRDCSAAPQQAQPQPSPQPQASYSCDNLTVTKGDGRKVSVKLDYTAKNGASLKSVAYDFGDGSQPLTTDKTTADYTYSKDGDYTVSAKLTVSANGKDQPVTGAACSKPFSVSTPAATPPATPAAPVGKSDLPNSGPGDVAALFVGATAVGFAFHRLVLSRSFGRR